MTLSINDVVSVYQLIPDMHIVGQNLGFNDKELDNWKTMNESLANKEGTFQMLKTWLEKGGSVDKFINALRQSGFGDLADSIQTGSWRENNQGPSGASNTQQPDQPQPLQSVQPDQPQPLQSVQPDQPQPARPQPARPQPARPQPARPQPGNDGTIDDETLRKLAKRLFTGVDDLASAIGVKYAELKRYKANNYRTGEVTADGTIQMLFDWREKVAPPEQRALLGQALQKAQLIRVKDEFHL